jgi:NAD-dependent deacetylase
MIHSKINEIAEMIIRSEKVVFFTGAGVSTESGIPDFRSPGGIWTKFDPEDFTIEKYISDPKSRSKQWNLLIENGLLINAEPNRAHLALAELDRLGKLQCIITQNIDNLHQKAGAPPEKVIELHGTMSWARCMDCGERFSIYSLLDEFRSSGKVPPCSICSGLIKPDVVFFGEALPKQALEESVRWSRTSDLFIVIGSSLVVYPAALMPIYAKESGATLVIINNTSTNLDSEADIIANGSAGEVMEKILLRVKSGL